MACENDLKGNDKKKFDQGVTIVSISLSVSLIHIKGYLPRIDPRRRCRLRPHTRGVSDLRVESSR